MNEEEKQTIKRIKRDYELAKSEDAIDIDIFTEDIKTVLNLLEKKDKIIDEMATYIATLDIEEDICEKTKNEHCDKMNFGECEDCIKQYYERKVENG